MLIRDAQIEVMVVSLDKITPLSQNFTFLLEHSPRLEKLAAQAERYVYDDPNTCLLKLRQFAEILALRMAAKVGLLGSQDDNFAGVLSRLQERGILTGDALTLFHTLRKTGNVAAHSMAGDQEEALQTLRLAWRLSVWFHRASKGKGHTPAFQLPPNPAEISNALANRLTQLQDELRQTKEQAELELKRLKEENAVLQTKAKEASPQEIETLVEQAQVAGGQMELDETETRYLIDRQLREAGWDADTGQLTYSKGARPQKGHHRAIAEWPTDSGPADYVLFRGLMPLAIIEAKRHSKDVPGVVKQSKRYSKGFTVVPDHLSPGGPWGEYRIPFLFATNGRAYLRQIETKSGIWFLDARKATNHPRALDGWYTPDGLFVLLQSDIDQANQRLQQESMNYLALRDYQKDAIRAVEQAIGDEARTMLLAMATGTGKTRTAIGLIYRLVKSKRFRSVLFLVDRSALGDQTLNALSDMRLENLQTFAEIYDVKGMDQQLPETDTRLHIATVQSVVRRILYPGADNAPLPVDLYDCIVVDECHRGYTLDKELSDSELLFRSEEDYISKYRRVLDHFDAIKIGLTATPALHTTELFGRPVYQYSYRQAVIDGYLVDHEPPLNIVTHLAKDGIGWQVGEQLELYDASSGQVDLATAPDELHFDVEAFNRQVITENFNRVVCAELAKHIDPFLPGKTLVFCATDSHADLVVHLLKGAFDQAYGAIDDEAIAKITGSVDQPLDLIRRFKNEQLPKIAVTVDLLTTGIDVPKIINLVFIRRVKSRILYEQMLGRATRLCDEIGKEHFHIFDAVDLYSTLEQVSSMKPVVKNPSISFAQLVEELTTTQDEAIQRDARDQLLAKLQRKAKKLKDDDGFAHHAGQSPQELLGMLHSSTPAQAATWFKSHGSLAPYLDQVRTGDVSKQLISHHEDHIVSVDHGYGQGQRPSDYLESFTTFLCDHLNLIPALVVVTQRPRDLTRQQLKELKLALDEHGFMETTIETAWRDMTNQEIAASIIGFVRQRVLGSPLVPYAQRVDQAIQRIITSRYDWTEPQRQWLKKIAAQMKQETIVDREAMDRGQFKANGGFNRINKIFNGRLEELLADLQEEIWKDVV